MTDIPGRGRVVSTCRSCHAPIRWGKTDNGKAIPLDAEPATEGNVILTTAGAAHVLAGANLEAARHPTAGERPELYMPHHATCPHARGWRRQ